MGHEITESHKWQNVDVNFVPERYGDNEVMFNRMKQEQILRDYF